MTIEPGSLIDLQMVGAEKWGLHLFEEIIKAFYRKILIPGDQVVDGGANAGLHTIPLAEAVGEHGRVLAFEPSPCLVESLMKTLNERNIRNVQIRQTALSLRHGTAKFHWLKNRAAESSLSNARIDPAQDEVESFDVTTVRLDDILPTTFDRCRFIKLDLEGAEFDALRGARQCLLRDRPTVILEFGYHAAAQAWGYDQAEWDAFYDAVGYRLYDLVGRPLLHRPWGELGSYIWYLIAVPKDSSDESLVLDGLMDEVAPIAKEWSLAMAEGRLPRSA